MEHFEVCITALVRGGRSVIATYPANAETLALYDAYKKTHPFTFGA